MGGKPEKGRKASEAIGNGTGDWLYIGYTQWIGWWENLLV